MKNTPAFPTQESRYPDRPPATLGMTLRDYFAAKALQGLLSSSTIMCTAPHITDLANRAYLIADAMLVEKKERA